MEGPENYWDLHVDISKHSFWILKPDRPFDCAINLQLTLVQSSQEKVISNRAVREWPQLTLVQASQWFLGLTIFFHCFSTLAVPIGSDQENPGQFNMDSWGTGGISALQLLSFGSQPWHPVYSGGRCFQHWGGCCSIQKVSKWAAPFMYFSHWLTVLERNNYVSDCKVLATGNVRSWPLAGSMSYFSLTKGSLMGPHRTICCVP